MPGGRHCVGVGDSGRPSLALTGALLYSGAGARKDAALVSPARNDVIIAWLWASCLAGRTTRVGVGAIWLNGRRWRGAAPQRVALPASLTPALFSINAAMAEERGACCRAPLGGQPILDASQH
jgi:hypothetical protein